MDRFCQPHSPYPILAARPAGGRFRPKSRPNPAFAGYNSEKAQYSDTPTLRSPGFEDEDEDDDEDEDENKAPRIAPAPGRFTAFLATLLAISRGWVPGIERGPSSVR